MPYIPTFVGIYLGPSLLCHFVAPRPPRSIFQLMFLSATKNLPNLYIELNVDDSLWPDVGKVLSENERKMRNWRVNEVINLSLYVFLQHEFNSNKNDNRTTIIMLRVIHLWSLLTYATYMSFVHLLSVFHTRNPFIFVTFHFCLCSETVAEMKASAFIFTHIFFFHWL